LHKLLDSEEEVQGMILGSEVDIGSMIKERKESLYGEQEVAASYSRV
jgi:hypothetical protein